MNKQKMLCLAEMLEQTPVKHFDGWEWGETKNGKKANLANYQECGTTACIAGWTCLYAGHQLDEEGVYDKDGKRVGFTADVAAKELELSDREADTLFYPDSGNWEPSDPKSAAEAVRRFVESGG
jgi:hypothetical protein